MTGGSLTNTGNVLEHTVKSTFEARGFLVMRYSEWMKNPKQYGNEVLLANVPYQTIYKHPGRTEFVLKSKKYGLEIRIECKWQQSAGSVDEKLPYVYLNALEAMPEEHIMVLIDGDGFKRGSIEWLKEVVREKRYTDTGTSTKKIEVMNLKEFITWANTTFR